MLNTDRDPQVGHTHSHEQFEAVLQDFSSEQLMGQNVMLAGAIDALEFLLREGATPENARQMLADARRSQGLVQAEARRRGNAIVYFHTRRG